MDSPERKRTQIFISYSRKDARWLERLRVHLRPLERDHKIAPWADTDIDAGSNWLEEIERSIEAARAAILLVSADFLASEFIANVELPLLLRAAEENETLLLTINVGPSLFSRTPALAKFQAVNDPAHPLTTLPEAAQEDVFVRVSEIIQRAFAEPGDASNSEHQPAAAELMAMTEGARKKSAPGSRTVDRRPRYKWALAILVLIGVLIVVAAVIHQATVGPSQGVVVRGRVTDREGRALDGAKVSVEGKGLPPLIYTDSEGVFTVKLPPDVKEINIRAEAEGYDLYNRRLSLSDRNELEEIRLKRRETAEKADLSGTVVDGNDRPLQGARVTLDDLPGMTPVETSSDGVFNLRDIPRKYGEGVRVRVVMEGYWPKPYTEDVVLGKAPPIIKLTREK